jgi:hypothetical protein
MTGVLPPEPYLRLAPSLRRRPVDHIVRRSATGGHVVVDAGNGEALDLTRREG